jgi:hypothetical protein
VFCVYTFVCVCGSGRKLGGGTNEHAERKEICWQLVRSSKHQCNNFANKVTKL